MNPDIHLDEIAFFWLFDMQAYYTTIVLIYHQSSHFESQSELCPPIRYQNTLKQLILHFAKYNDVTWRFF